MPYVNIRLLAGVSREQKARIVASVTQTLVQVLGKKPEHTHVVIDEVSPENWGYAGGLSDELPEVRSTAASVTRGAS